MTKFRKIAMTLAIFGMMSAAVVAFTAPAWADSDGNLCDGRGRYGDSGC